jgi:hypothetical protein
VMHDDEDLKSLRGVARTLRYEPDDPLTYERIAATVRSRMERPASLLEVFAAWLRPVGAAVAVATLIATISSAALATADDEVATTTPEIALLMEDVYRVAE